MHCCSVETFLLADRIHSGGLRSWGHPYCPCCLVLRSCPRCLSPCPPLCSSAASSRHPSIPAGTSTFSGPPWLCLSLWIPLSLSLSWGPSVALLFCPATRCYKNQTMSSHQCPPERLEGIDQVSGVPWAPGETWRHSSICSPLRGSPQRTARCGPGPAVSSPRA